MRERRKSANAITQHVSSGLKDTHTQEETTVSNLFFPQRTDMLKLQQQYG